MALSESHILSLNSKKHVKIYLLSKHGLSRKEIAEKLGTNPGHVGNEIKAYAKSEKKRKEAKAIAELSPAEIKGMEVEKEHENLYEELKSRLKKTGTAMPMSKAEFFKEIADAHIKEKKDYYDLLEKYVEKYSKSKNAKIGWNKEGMKKRSTKDLILITKNVQHYGSNIYNLAKEELKRRDGASSGTSIPREFTFTLPHHKHTPKVEAIEDPKKFVKQHKAMLLAFLEYSAGIDGALAIAANQCFLNGNQLKYNFTALDGKDGWFIAINPKIEAEYGKATKTKEECLTFPGKQVVVTRYPEVLVSYYDINGKHKATRVKGMEAQVWQHEIDHLHGVEWPIEDLGLAFHLSYGGKVAKNQPQKKFKDTHGRLRFEIDDSTADIRVDKIIEYAESIANTKKQISVPLHRIMPTWEGYIHYPDMKDIVVVFVGTADEDSYLYAYNMQKDVIIVNANYIYHEKRNSRVSGRNSKNDSGRMEGTRNDFSSGHDGPFRRRLIHELQHPIQKREGIEIEPSTPEYIIRQLKIKHGKIGMPDPEFREWIEHEEGRPYNHIEFEFYKNMSSEKEALDVEKRAAYTKGQRDSIPPDIKSAAEGVLVGPTDINMDKHPERKGIDATLPDGKPIKLGGGEIIMNEKASTENCEELSRMNQESGGIAFDCDAQKDGNTDRRDGKMPKNEFHKESASSGNLTEKPTKNEINNIISGTGEVARGATIQAALIYIRGEAGAIQKGAVSAEKQKERIIDFANKNNLWCLCSEKLNEGNYIGQGMEQKVYEDPDSPAFVIKENNLFFYDSWEEYLTNLLLHNYFFPKTSYELIGFNKTANGSAIPVVRQAYIEQTTETNLSSVESFLSSLGFRRQHPRMDIYENKELGIIIGDLHNGNVLTKDGVLYFIDTKFFLTESASTGKSPAKMYDVQFWVDGKFKEIVMYKAHPHDPLQPARQKPLLVAKWIGRQVAGQYSMGELYAVQQDNKYAKILLNSNKAEQGVKTEHMKDKIRPHIFKAYNGDSVHLSDADFNTMISKAEKEASEISKEGRSIKSYRDDVYLTIKHVVAGYVDGGINNTSDSLPTEIYDEFMRERGEYSSHSNQFTVGQKVYVPDVVSHNKRGTIKSINGDMAQVDFGNGDIYGIMLHRIQPDSASPDTTPRADAGAKTTHMKFYYLKIGNIIREHVNKGDMVAYNYEIISHTPYGVKLKEHSVTKARPALEFEVPFNILQTYLEDKHYTIASGPEHTLLPFENDRDKALLENEILVIKAKHEAQVLSSELDSTKTEATAKKIASHSKAKSLKKTIKGMEAMTETNAVRELWNHEEWEYDKKPEAGSPLTSSYISMTSIHDDRTKKILSSLPVFQDDVVPEKNPDGTKEPYILHNPAISEFFLVNTEGYDYPRYITCLDGWSPNIDDYAKGTKISKTGMQLIMEETHNAYMRDTYGSKAWENAINLLHKEGYTQEEIAWILNSKYMRWSSDAFNDGEKPLTGSEIIEYKKNWGIDLTELHGKKPKKEVIVNQYKGKLPQEVWHAWTKDQRRHFLEDHAGKIPNQYITDAEIESHIGSAYENLPVPVKSALKHHISEGQYSSGTKIKANKFLETIRVSDRNIDLKDVTVQGTPKGNWEVFHKGKRLMVVNANLLDEDTIREYGLEHHASSGTRLPKLKIKKLTKEKKFYHARFHSPKGATRFATPAWASTLADSVHEGSEITMMKDAQNEWHVQRILIPVAGVSKPQAREIATKIASKLRPDSASLGAYLAGTAGYMIADRHKHKLHKAYDSLKYKHKTASGGKKTKKKKKTKTVK